MFLSIVIATVVWIVLLVGLSKYVSILGTPKAWIVSWFVVFFVVFEII